MKSILSLIIIILYTLTITYSFDMVNSGWKQGVNETFKVRIKKYFTHQHFSIPVKHLRLKTNLKTFEYFLNSPEKAVPYIKDLKIGNYKIIKRSEGYFLDDKAGVKIDFKEVYSKRFVRIIYANGTFKKIVRGSGIVSISYELDKNTKEIIFSANCYIRLNSTFLYFLSRLLKPIIMNKFEKKIKRYADNAKIFFNHLDKTDFNITQIDNRLQIEKNSH